MTDPHRGVESLPVNDQPLLVVVMTSHFHARTMRPTNTAAEVTGMAEGLKLID
jgi:hypothetical protein